MTFNPTMTNAGIIVTAACWLGGCTGLHDPTSSLQAVPNEASAVSQLVQGDTGRPRHRLPCYRPDARHKNHRGEYYEVRGGQLVRVFRCLR